MSKSLLETRLALVIKDAGLPEPEREYRWAAAAVGFGPGVRARLRAARLSDWRFDFAWPDHKLAAEVEGGIWTHGRHTRGSGFTQDAEKYNLAAIRCGWTVLRFTGSMIRDGRALSMIKEALGE